MTTRSFITLLNHDCILQRFHTCQTKNDKRYKPCSSHSSQPYGYQETETLQHVCHNFAWKSQIIWKESTCPSQMFDSSRHLKLALSGSRQGRKKWWPAQRPYWGETQLGRITASVSTASNSIHHHQWIIRFISTNTCQHSSDLPSPADQHIFPSVGRPLPSRVKCESTDFMFKSNAFGFFVWFVTFLRFGVLHDVVESFPIQLPGNASDVVLWSHPKSGLSWCVTGSCQETRVSCIYAGSPFCIVEKRLCCAANILRLRKVLGKVTMSLPKHWISLNHWTCIPKHELPENVSWSALLDHLAAMSAVASWQEINNT